MKVTFPKNIKKWLLSWMNINVWPINLSIVQLFLVALWVGLALAVFQAASKSWSTAMGIVFAIPVLIIFIIIAFFRLSEMNLLEYLSKLLRNKFFDTTKKFQHNFEKDDKITILIKKSKLEDKKQKIEQKDNNLNQKVLDSIEKGGLF